MHSVEMRRNQFLLILTMTFSSLSEELKEKLKTTKPETIAQATRISGMTPVGLALIMAHLDKEKRKERARV